MQVVKRDGSRQLVSVDKILSRVSSLSNDLPGVSPIEVVKACAQGLHDGVQTRDLDCLAAKICAQMAVVHPDYALLGGRLCTSNNRKECPQSFQASMERLRPTLLPSYCIFIDKYHAELERMIVPDRDSRLDFFGSATLRNGYLLKDNEDRVAETPQMMYMRVAVALHHPRESVDGAESVLAEIRVTYDLLSRGLYGVASPTMFNAGLRRNQQLASCFLLQVKSDSIEGIFDTVKDCAVISKSGGGLGIWAGNVRASGSRIYSTGGAAAGLVPLCRLFNETARFADQAGRRKGAFAVYLPVWHKDIFNFLDLRKNTGAPETRARDLFQGLMVPDLFMQRVEEDGPWALFCPTQVQGLDECYGEFWAARYVQAEKSATHKIKARELWSYICRAQIEQGQPYMIYRDAANQKSNQRNLGAIKNSNLCAEIIQYSDEKDTACCNLASLALHRFVNKDMKSVDFESLRLVTKQAIRNLDAAIDATSYPTPEAKNSNLQHRPLGLGICGLADLFALLEIPFESVEAQTLNQLLMREIYFAAVSASIDLAEERGAHPSYDGSPASQSLLQPELWGLKLTSDRWLLLKKRLSVHGLRNSLLIALMPTATTSQILGCAESFEPCFSNLMVRRTLAGEYTVLNKYLVKALSDRGLWNEKVREQLLRDEGSVQKIDSVPDDLKKVFKTVWEVPLKTQIELSAGRGPYVCQSQSLNLHVSDPSERKLSSAHFHAWRLGLKTGCYYVRTRAVTSARAQSCSDSEVCVMCTV